MPPLTLAKAQKLAAENPVDQRVHRSGPELITPDRGVSASETTGALSALGRLWANVQGAAASVLAVVGIGGGCGAGCTNCGKCREGIAAKVLASLDPGQQAAIERTILEERVTLLGASLPSGELRALKEQIKILQRVEENPSAVREILAAAEERASFVKTIGRVSGSFSASESKHDAKTFSGTITKGPVVDIKQAAASADLRDSSAGTGGQRVRQGGPQGEASDAKTFSGTITKGAVVDIKQAAASSADLRDSSAGTGGQRVRQGGPQGEASKETAAKGHGKAVLERVEKGAAVTIRLRDEDETKLRRSNARVDAARPTEKKGELYEKGMRLAPDAQLFKRVESTSSRSRDARVISEVQPTVGDLAKNVAFRRGAPHSAFQSFERVVARLERSVARQAETVADRPLHRALAARMDSVLRAAIEPKIRATLDRRGIGTKIELLARSGSRATSGREIQMTVRLMRAELQRASGSSRFSPPSSTSNPGQRTQALRTNTKRELRDQRMTRAADGRGVVGPAARSQRPGQLDATRRIASRGVPPSVSGPNRAKAIQQSIAQAQRTLSRISQRPGVKLRDVVKHLASLSRRLTPERLREILRRSRETTVRRSADRSALRRRTTQRNERVSGIEKETRRALLLRFREAMRRREERRLKRPEIEERQKNRPARPDRSRRDAQQRELSTNPNLHSRPSSRGRRRGEREAEFSLSPTEMRLLEKLIKKLGQGGSIDDLVRQVRKQRKGGGKAKIVASPKKLKEAQTAASDGGPEGAVEKVTFDGATTGSKTLDLNTAKVG